MKASYQLPILYLPFNPNDLLLKKMNVHGFSGTGNEQFPVDHFSIMKVHVLATLCKSETNVFPKL